MFAFKQMWSNKMLNFHSEETEIECFVYFPGMDPKISWRSIHITPLEDWDKLEINFFLKRSWFIFDSDWLKNVFLTMLERKDFLNYFRFCSFNFIFASQVVRISEFQDVLKQARKQIQKFEFLEPMFF